MLAETLHKFLIQEETVFATIRARIIDFRELCEQIGKCRPVKSPGIVKWGGRPSYIRKIYDKSIDMDDI